MKKNNFRKIAAYATPTLFILCWWLVAFFPRNSQEHPFFYSVEESPSFTSPIPYLSSMNRESIRLALNGDISLIGKLLAEWDLDADILQNHGFDSIKKLPRQCYIRAQMVSRLLKKNNLADPAFTYIPQTYIAATHLISLVPPKNLLCLPKGLRDQTELFPPSVTEKIPLDFDLALRETLFLKQPSLAFISSISHPATIWMLKNQKIKSVLIECPKTIEEIPENIKRLGNYTNTNLKAELINTFLAAAFIAIENRVSALGALQNQKVMLLNYYSQFSLPPKNSFTNQLLQRLKINTCDENTQSFYLLPTSQESIIKAKPDKLLIATDRKNKVPISREMQQMTKIFLIDEAIQHSPTQFIVLAYYDIAKALLTK
jgi:iron complex transport system substrate-binding protein